ncbi:MAG: ATP-binding cassette domain-containing protein [Alicyclobacillaceae bacterium]|nr:ATP-binding cassette domain-containing protein [Alicyclobacillaceae bacterium]
MDVHRRIVVDGRDRHLLRGVNGSVTPGRVVTLVGPSGAGKSTLLSLCNLLQTPDEGAVFVWGWEVRQWPVRELRRRVGLVMQQPVMLPGTVADNLAAAARLHAEAEPDNRGLLRLVGLPAELLARPAGALSGGEKQRIALLRTLANRPEILLLDEATSALDRESAAVVEELVLRRVRDEGLTVLWVTHDLALARRVGDETWLVVDGRVVEQRPTAAFFDDPQSEWARRLVRGHLAPAEGGEGT